MTKHSVTVSINGDETDFTCTPEQTLLDVLRGELHMTGTKNKTIAPHPPRIIGIKTQKLAKKKVGKVNYHNGLWQLRIRRS